MYCTTHLSIHSHVCVSFYPHVHSYLYTYLPILHYASTYPSPIYSSFIHPNNILTHLVCLSTHPFIIFSIYWEVHSPHNPCMHAYICYISISRLSIHHPSMYPPIHHQFLLPQSTLHSSTCSHPILLLILLTCQALSWRGHIGGLRVSRKPSL